MTEKRVIIQLKKTSISIFGFFIIIIIVTLYCCGCNEIQLPPVVHATPTVIQPFQNSFSNRRNHKVQPQQKQHRYYNVQSNKSKIQQQQQSNRWFRLSTNIRLNIQQSFVKYSIQNPKNTPYERVENNNDRMIVSDRSATIITELAVSSSNDGIDSKQQRFLLFCRGGSLTESTATSKESTTSKKTMKKTPTTKSTTISKVMKTKKKKSTKESDTIETTTSEEQSKIDESESEQDTSTKRSSKSAVDYNDDETTTKQSSSMKKSMKKSSPASKPMMKKKKKDTTATKLVATASRSTNDKVKDEIIHALKEKDSAEVLGDAIRSRVDQIRNTGMHNNNNPSIQSLGWAMGATDYTNKNTLYQEIIYNDDNNKNDDDTTIDNDDDSSAGGVEASPSSVVAHYFLNSHGGAHAIQCICSVFAVSTGLLSLLIGAISTGSSSNIQQQLIFQRRCFTFAMIKHITGLLSACAVAAQSIPKVGFQQSRLWIQTIIQDPVSQYVFYSACMLLWLPNPSAYNLLPNINPTLTTPSPATTITTEPTDTTGATISTQDGSKVQHILLSALRVPEWQSFPLVSFCLVGPVILRELISTMFVTSDVLVLWSTAAASGGNNGESTFLIQSILSIAQNIVNAIMCLLVTPSKWKSSNASQRQELLAKLTSKCTLFMEIIVGAIMTIDCLWNTFVILLFGTSNSNIKGSSTKQIIFQLIKRCFCTQLYLQFLWVRKQKIKQLQFDIRGGASQVPLHILDIVLHPMERMGITESTKDNNKKKGSLAQNSNNNNNNNNNADSQQQHHDWDWIDYVRIGLALNESS